MMSHVPSPVLMSPDLSPVPASSAQVLAVEPDDDDEEGGGAAELNVGVANDALEQVHSRVGYR